MSTTVKILPPRVKAIAPPPSVQTITLEDAAAGHLRQRAIDAATFLRCQVTVWEARGQTAALDNYLTKVARKRSLGARRSLGALSQYHEFADAVAAAALILGAPIPSAPVTAIADVPVEMWQCSGCLRTFDRETPEHTCTSLQLEAQGAHAASDTASLARDAERLAQAIRAAEPVPAVAASPEPSHDRAADAVLGELPGDEQPAGTPAPDDTPRSAAPEPGTSTGTPALDWVPGLGDGLPDGGLGGCGL